MDDVMMLHRDAVLHQNGIAVPPPSNRLHVERHGGVIGVVLDQEGRQHTGGVPKRKICLLQRDDIGVDILQDLQDRAGSRLRSVPTPLWML